ncbi:MAG: 2,3-bisphosphoglycerate-independent phosphoglycerate mutase [Patescibacteria group bacterium]|mgnify:CR=1 FL=1
METKIILLILDGFGISLKEQGNAVSFAKTPTLDYLIENYPFSTLKAAGLAAGLSESEAGNSEVGHLILGSGRIIYQYMPRIIESIRDKSFFKNEALVKAIKNVKKHGSNLHLMGLLGTGSAHSYIDHLYGLLELARQYNLGKYTKLHIFVDGKDSAPFEGANLIRHINIRLKETGTGEIASVIGRLYAMDRDYNWDRTKSAFELIVKGNGLQTIDPEAAVREMYIRGFNDNNMPAIVVTDKNGVPNGTVNPYDSVIFFNYREDRARQITRSFVTPNKVTFKPEVPKEIVFVGFSEYERGLPMDIAFNPPEVKECLAQVLSDSGKTQLHIAETEKYAHITYFFNGFYESKFENEDWILIPSFDVYNFADKPELKTYEIIEKIINAIKENKYDFIVANIANFDLLGHTGDFGATVKSIEYVDKLLKEIVNEVEQDEQKIMIVTGDHGNAEKMIDPFTGNKLTEHSRNNVPFILINKNFKTTKSQVDILKEKKDPIGQIADVAPTILELFNIKKPAVMTGASLLSKLLSEEKVPKDFTQETILSTNP